MRRNHEHSHRRKTAYGLNSTLNQESKPIIASSDCLPRGRRGTYRIEGNSGSGAWTRTRISSSKGWRATDCTTPDQGTTSLLETRHRATVHQNINE